MKSDIHYINFYRFFILIALSIAVVTTKAQDHSSFFGFKTGASFPISKYKQANLNQGSFARTGYNVTAEGAWFFKEKFGVGGSVSINQHPVDVGLLGWEKVQADPFLEDLYIRSEPYLMLTAFIGFNYRTYIFDKFYFTSKLQGGILYGKTPYQLYKPTYFIVGPEYYEITSARDWKIAGNAGIGIQYNITNCYSIVLDADVTYGELAFGFNSASGYQIDRRAVSFINTSLGLRIKI